MVHIYIQTYLQLSVRQARKTQTRTWTLGRGNGRLVHSDVHNEQYCYKERREGRGLFGAGSEVTQELATTLESGETNA